jgi:hypothetical protein
VQLAVALLIALISSDEEMCRQKLRVVGASATFRTPMFKGQPMRRDAEIDVEVSSSSTTSIASVELAIFLGASLKSIKETRLSALPTARPRALDDGGIAFRAEVEMLISPGEARTLKVVKEAVPLDKDIGAVTALVSTCRTLRSVGEAVLSAPKPRDDSSTRLVIGLAAGLALVIILIVLVRMLA